ncbi:MAG: hypothetical protein C0403_16630, partial [Desulfobacterium sp.]|nr:hypothetical protein [Desulfobacterium sp.]
MSRDADSTYCFHKILDSQTDFNYKWNQKMNSNLQKEKTVLIRRAIEVIEKSGLEEIWRAGIRRDPKNYHITVMYPPLKAMDQISEDTIFTNFQNVSREFA